MTTAKKQPIIIDGYTIDASISEDHSFDSDVTDFPVEQGANITDNVRPKPIVITIEGIVSDTPLGAIADIRHGDDTFTPSNEALAVLEGIRAARQPVTIQTTLRVFENMLMSGLSIPRDPQTGAALRFSATFTEVILVTNNRTTVRVATPSSGSAKGLGHKKLTELKQGDKGPPVDWHQGTPPGATLKPGHRVVQVQYLEQPAHGASNNVLLRGTSWQYVSTGVQLTAAEDAARQADMNRDARSEQAKQAIAGKYNNKQIPKGVNKANLAKGAH